MAESCWIIIHLGKNPKKGGKPPNDSRLINRQNFKIVDWIDRE